MQNKNDLLHSQEYLETCHKNDVNPDIKNMVPEVVSMIWEVLD